MALAEVVVFRSLVPDEVEKVLEAVHDSLVDALQVPADDPTVWLNERPPSHLYQPNPFGPETTLVRVTLFAGRSPKTKHRLHEDLAVRLEAAGVRRDTVVVVLVESPRENWSTAGVPSDQADVGFRIDI